MFAIGDGVMLRQSREGVGLLPVLNEKFGLYVEGLKIKYCGQTPYGRGYGQITKTSSPWQLMRGARIFSPTSLQGPIPRESRESM